MTDDIAGLISKFNYWRGYPVPTVLTWAEVRADLAKAADALISLAADLRALAQENAKLKAITIEIEEESHRDFQKLEAEACSQMRKCDALAQENERLHERLEDNHEFQLIDGKMTRVEVAPGSIPDGIECRNETIKLQDERNDRQSERIRELEAERDAALLPSTMCANLVAERDAIRAKTIEECAKICEPIEGEHFPPSWDATAIERQHATRRWCAAAIRELAQTDEGKTETRK